MFWRLLLGTCLLATAVQAQRSYRSHSVLAAGSWHVLGVTTAGVYRIDATYLRAMGISPASIDPRTLRIYGHGGGMLPQANNAARIDDLSEHAIQVVGQADGVFDESDYILFYAEGPHVWRTRADGSLYHEQHHYSDSNYYYLTHSQGTGLRMATVAAGSSPTPAPTALGLQHHEVDAVNLLHSGRQWFGDAFGGGAATTRSYNFALPQLAAGSQVVVQIRVAARADAASSFGVRANESSLGSVHIPAVNTQSLLEHAKQEHARYLIAASALGGGSLNISLSYSGGGTGWLDAIGVQYEQQLQLVGAELHYSTPAHTNPSALQAQLVGADASVQIWQVTQPTAVRQQHYALAGSTASYAYTNDSVRHWLAFRPAAARSPHYRGRLANQDLHASPAADYLIIYAPHLAQQAQQLAQFHSTHYGRRVLTATPQQIYQEFSSGKQDVTALRDFVKMLYDRAAGNAANQPKFLLLLGQGSYDYVGRTVGGSQVPAYQSRESLLATNSYTSDDYYGFLEDHEGFWGEQGLVFEGDDFLDIHSLDLAIGRLPANTATEAQVMVDKIIAYATGTGGAGQWQTRVTLIGDYKEGEGSLHSSQADSCARSIAQRMPCLQQEKIYLDQYPSTTAGANRLFPGAVDAVQRALARGSLLVNFTGHGSERVLSNANIVEASTITQLRNGSQLPFWVTATCEFGRYDDPTQRSGALQLLAQPGGGAIGLLGGVRLAYSFPNFVFNLAWYEHCLTYLPSEGRYISLGQACRNAKNALWAGAPINTRNFALLCDPGIGLALPTHRVVLTHINNQPASTTPPDTLKALDLVTLRGQVQDAAGNHISSYAGSLQVQVYDKANSLRTLLGQMPYSDYRSVLFSGAATVVNGSFELQFVVPQDISYTIGRGNLLLYVTDAQSANPGMGCWQQAVVCCTSSNPPASDSPPTLQLYMNDSLWRSGSVVDERPTLIARVQDDLGINTSGLGIGHDITAVLNGDERNPIVLNAYYRALQDSYTTGELRYTLDALPEGRHTLRVRVWDVANQSATAETEMVVAHASTWALGQVFNYPNPFAAATTFVLSHNQGQQPVQVSLSVYNMQGALVASLAQAMQGSSLNLPWQGSDNQGQALPTGIYFYTLELQNAEGQSLRKTQRLLILR